MNPPFDPTGPRSVASFRSPVVSTLALTALFFLASALYGQVGKASATVSPSVTTERVFVCAEDIKPPHEIPIKHVVWCESRDCCPLCPGPPDLRIRVDAGAKMVFFRFQGLSSKAKKRLKIEGNAKWGDDGRLKIGPGDTSIRGLQTGPDGSWPIVIASVVPAGEDETSRPIAPRNFDATDGSRKPERRARRAPPSNRFTLSVQQFRGSTVVGDLRFSLLSKPCKVGTGTGPGVPIAVSNEGGWSVTVFDGLANGNVPPMRIIQGSHTLLHIAASVATDASGRIYVLNPGDTSGPEAARVTVYDAGATGDVAPIRAITSSAFTNGQVNGFAVDDTGRVFVGNLGIGGNGPGTVAVFPSGSNGLSTPTQVITDGAERPFAIAVDRSGAKLYVGIGRLDGPISIYERGPTGQYVRTATIFPSVSELEDVDWAGLAVDARGTIYALSSDGFGGNSTVFVFEPDASGALHQTRRIGLADEGTAIAVNAQSLFVTGPFFSQPFSDLPDEIEVFPAQASGPTPPVRAIRGASTQLGAPRGIAIIH